MQDTCVQSLGWEDWDALLREHGAQIALLSKEFPVFNLMQLKPDWLLIYEDSVSGLFVQRGSSLVDQIQQTDAPELPDDSTCLCFP